MGLWKKVVEHEPNQQQQTTKLDNSDEKILDIIDAAFGLPEDVKKEVISTIDEIIKKGLKNGSLNYLKTLECACEGYTKEQIPEAYGHQLLGAYVAYLILTGKPLKLK